jgi:hypothetical protein
MLCVLGSTTTVTDFLPAQTEEVFGAVDVASRAGKTTENQA